MYGYTQRRPFFYPREIPELALAILSVYAVFLSMAGFTLSPLWMLYIFVLSFLVYVPHEMAHKFTALHYGYPARFKLIPEYFALTLISAIPFVPIKIIVPGTVLIYTFGPIDKAKNGIISAAGPLTNLVIGYAALAYGLLGHPLAVTLAQISGWIAFFNLIPFGPLDGRKIASWSIPVWLVLLGASVYLSFFI